MKNLLFKKIVIMLDKLLGRAERFDTFKAEDALQISAHNLDYTVKKEVSPIIKQIMSDTKSGQRVSYVTVPSYLTPDLRSAVANALERRGFIVTCRDQKVAGLFTGEFEYVIEW